MQPCTPSITLIRNTTPSTSMNTIQNECPGTVVNANKNWIPLIIVILAIGIIVVILAWCWTRKANYVAIPYTKPIVEDVRLTNNSIHSCLTTKLQQAQRDGKLTSQQAGDLQNYLNKARNDINLSQNFSNLVQQYTNAGQISEGQRIGILQAYAACTGQHSPSTYPPIHPRIMEGYNNVKDIINNNQWTNSADCGKTLMYQGKNYILTPFHDLKMQDAQGRWWTKGTGSYWWLEYGGNMVRKDNMENMLQLDKQGKAWGKGKSDASWKPTLLNPMESFDMAADVEEMRDYLVSRID